MPFPHKKLGYTEEEKRAMFNNLTRSNLRVSPKDLTIRVPADMYEKCDVLGDLFTEEARIKSHIKGHKSPAEYWETVRQNPAETAPKIREYLARTGRELNILSLRDFVYVNCRECTQFKPSLARAIYKYMAQKVGVEVEDARIYDPCMGWGDRLLAALSLGVTSYHGTDPNSDAHRGYGSIVEFTRGVLTCSPPCDVRISDLPFEKVPADASRRYKYDMILASPPFFNYETYGDLPTPDDAGAWLKGWLLPCIDNMLHMLRDGGCLALYIAPVPDLDIPRELLQHKPPDEKITYVRGRKRRSIDIFLYYRNELTEEQNHTTSPS